jgi:hypothetical protein
MYINSTTLKPMEISSMGNNKFPLMLLIHMAKSAANRHEAKRIYKNWVYKCKEGNTHYKLESLSFGKVFKQDPWDCGRPQCGVCNGWKIKEFSKRREALRKDERKALNELN